MKIAIRFLQEAQLPVFAALGIAAFVQWRRRDVKSTGWLAAAFGIFAFTVVVRRFVPANFGIFAFTVVVRRFLPANSDDALVIWADKISIALLFLFPYCLYRFMASFRAPPRWMNRLAFVLTAAVCTGILLFSEVPPVGQPRSAAFQALAFAILLQWSALSFVVAWRLWKSGGTQPTVARRRMKTLSAGALVMSAGIILAGVSNFQSEAGIASLLVQILVFTSAPLFLAGFAPPKILRTIWREPEMEAFRAAEIDLMEVLKDPSDVAQCLLPHAARLVGGTGAVLINISGEIVGSYGLSPLEERAIADIARRAPRGAGQIMQTSEIEGEETTSLLVPLRAGWLAVQASAYTPYFGPEEASLVQSLSVLVDLAMERVHFITREHEALERERAASQRLTELIQLKNDFVGMVAHDLRSPMSGIIGFADTLTKRWDVLTPEQRQEFATRMGTSARNMARLVEDVLQVARIESEEFEFEIAPFDLKTLIERVVRDMRESDSQPPERFLVRTAEYLPLVLGDEERHRQILNNLLSNAAKFSGEHEPVEISAYLQDGMVTVAVTDNGAGIRKEDMHKLFTRFSRIVPLSGAKKVKGTGLGLYICKKIVEAQGGEIWAESVPGLGSTFFFTTPIVTSKAHESRLAKTKQVAI